MIFETKNAKQDDTNAPRTFNLMDQPESKAIERDGARIEVQARGL